jgi:hypothetical protein
MCWIFCIKLGRKWSVVSSTTTKFGQSSYTSPTQHINFLCFVELFHSHFTLCINRTLQSLYSSIYSKRSSALWWTTKHSNHSQNCKYAGRTRSSTLHLMTSVSWTSLRTLSFLFVTVFLFTNLLFHLSGHSHFYRQDGHSHWESNDLS